MFTFEGFERAPLLGWHEDRARWVGWIVAALVTLSLAAIFVGPLARKRLIQFLILLALTAAWIAIARPTTPVQFTWALAVPVGGLIALGLWALAQRFRFAAPLVVCLVASGFLFNAWVARGLASMVRDGEGRLPSLVLDRPAHETAAHARETGPPPARSLRPW